mmetsp:Transcript_75060/g.200298  ORF Transcript_75060/g.200298 Transcript_75060/m.200298 type:complete len:137 (-) Transcript_75060:117-527(-)
MGKVTPTKRRQSAAAKADHTPPEPKTVKKPASQASKKGKKAQAVEPGAVPEPQPAASPEPIVEQDAPMTDCQSPEVAPTAPPRKITPALMSVAAQETIEDTPSVVVDIMARMKKRQVMRHAGGQFKMTDFVKVGAR